MKYSMEIVHKIWNDSLGECIEVGPDGDGLGIEIISKGPDGKPFTHTTIYSEEQLVLLISALQAYVGKLEGTPSK
jgi:hypothetical protein